MSAKPGRFDALMARLGHVFSDTHLLVEALTHASAASPKKPSYERLEFLGDRVLGLAVADMLMRAYPRDDEGELSRRFTTMVRSETCAEVAIDLGLGAYLALGPGEASSGGRRKETILGDATEAVIGAIYLDAGPAAAHAFVEREWRPLLGREAAARRDAKSELQEWAQGRGLPLPVYTELERSGPDHEPVFVVGVSVPGLVGTEGRGRSKRLAEQAAAEACLVANGARGTR
jgi:ribonuclease III